MDNIPKSSRQLIEVMMLLSILANKSAKLAWNREDAASKSLEDLVTPGGSNCRVTDLGPGQVTPMVSVRLAARPLIALTCCMSSIVQTLSIIISSVCWNCAL